MRNNTTVHDGKKYLMVLTSGCYFHSAYAYLHGAVDAELKMNLPKFR